MAQLAQLTQYALMCFKLHIVDKFMLQNVVNFICQLRVIVKQIVILLPIFV